MTSQTSPKDAIANIHTSLDALLQVLEDNPQAVSSERLVEQLYSSHLTLDNFEK